MRGMLTSKPEIIKTEVNENLHLSYVSALRRGLEVAARMLQQGVIVPHAMLTVQSKPALIASALHRPIPMLSYSRSLRIMRDVSASLTRRERFEESRELR